jgi:excisionase family DNA binding protein
MTAIGPVPSELLLPSELTMKQAAAAAQALRGLVSAAVAEGSQSLKLRPVARSSDSSIELPVATVRVLVEALEHSAAGNASIVVPLHRELTTQEAADLLNVSRPYLVSLLEAGKIPYRKVGSRRRVMLEDLLTYKNEETRHSRKLLDELTTEAQEMGLGY